MTARKFDISIEQGATFVMTLTYKDDTGTPIDLTGYKVEMQVRDKVGGRIFMSANTANGRITVNTVGQIMVRVPHTETREIQLVYGVYDLFLHNATDDFVEKLVFGDAIVGPSVTR